jgi:hypothetical protein
MKSSTTHQKAHLPTTLASLNNGHISDLRACCAGVRSYSRPNLVPARPLRLRNTTWRSSLVANLSSTALRHTPTTKAEARAATSHHRVATTTLVCSFIWPCNSSMLNRCTNFFSISPSLASNFVRCRLSLRSSYLGTSIRVSTA